MKKDELIYRELIKNDVESLAEFFSSNNDRETIKQFNPFPLTKKSAFKLLSPQSVDHFFGVFHGEIIIGFSMLRGWDEGYDIPSFGILIDRNYRNKGISKELLHYTLNKALDLGCEKVRLSVYLNNPSAVELYRKNGFAEVEKNEVHIFGQLMKKMIMIKKLKRN